MPTFWWARSFTRVASSTKALYNLDKGLLVKHKHSIKGMFLVFIKTMKRTIGTNGVHVNLQEPIKIEASKRKKKDLTFLLTYFSLNEGDTLFNFSNLRP